MRAILLILTKPIIWRQYSNGEDYLTICLTGQANQCDKALGQIASNKKEPRHESVAVP